MVHHRLQFADSIEQLGPTLPGYPRQRSNDRSKLANFSVVARPRQRTVRRVRYRQDLLDVVLGADFDGVVLTLLDVESTVTEVTFMNLPDVELLQD